MVLYFTGTGNSFAVARHIAAATGDSLLPLAEAAGTDLSAETTVGLVYPCYDFNTPPAVRDLVARLQLRPSAYLFIVVTCGAQTGNSVWTVRRILRRKGVRVAYCHKIRMPDNSATLFGRNPNDQLWKLEKYAPRLQRIVDDVRARRRAKPLRSPRPGRLAHGHPSRRTQTPRRLQTPGQPRPLHRLRPLRIDLPHIKHQHLRPQPRRHRHRLHRLSRLPARLPPAGHPGRRQTRPQRTPIPPPRQ